MPVLMLGGMGVCAGYVFALWVKGQEPPRGKDPNIKHASLGISFDLECFSFFCGGWSKLSKHILPLARVPECFFR